MNHLVCDYTSSDDAFIPKKTNLMNLGSRSDTISSMVGIAINGVPIFNGNSPQNMDYFYPKEWEGSNNQLVSAKLDGCLGAIESDNMYHYWFLPPCLIDSDHYQTTKYCEDIPECNEDMRIYA